MTDVLTPTLFDAGVDDATANVPGAVHRDDPPTSHQAALANAPRSGSQRGRLLLALAAAGEHGMTDYGASIAARIARPHVAGTRRAELLRLGLVEEAGGTALTDTGSPALLWRLTEAGRTVAEQMRREEQDRAR